MKCRFSYRNVSRASRDAFWNSWRRNILLGTNDTPCPPPGYMVWPLRIQVDIENTANGNHLLPDCYFDPGVAIDGVRIHHRDDCTVTVAFNETMEKALISRPLSINPTPSGGLGHPLRY
jgi:hypothetical protein